MKATWVHRPFTPKEGKMKCVIIVRETIHRLEFGFGQQRARGATWHFGFGWPFHQNHCSYGFAIAMDLFLIAQLESDHGIGHFCHDYTWWNERDQIRKRSRDPHQSFGNDNKFTQWLIERLCFAEVQFWSVQLRGDRSISGSTRSECGGGRKTWQLSRKVGADPVFWLGAMFWKLEVCPPPEFVSNQNPKPHSGTFGWKCVVVLKTKGQCDRPQGPSVFLAAAKTTKRDRTQEEEIDRFWDKFVLLLILTSPNIRALVDFHTSKEETWLGPGVMNHIRARSLGCIWFGCTQKRMQSSA